MNCLLFNYTSCSPKQKSTIVILYKRYISVEKACYVVDLTPNLVDVTLQTMWHYDVMSQTMRHHLKRSHHPWDIRVLRHKPCNIKYCRPHVINLWTNEMAFIYILYNKRTYYLLHGKFGRFFYPPFWDGGSADPNKNLSSFQGITFVHQRFHVAQLPRMHTIHARLYDSGS